MNVVFFVVLVPCSSDDGDLDRLLGDDDYSNADNVVQAALKEEIPVGTFINPLNSAICIIGCETITCEPKYRLYVRVRGLNSFPMLIMCFFRIFCCSIFKLIFLILKLEIIFKFCLRICYCLPLGAFEIPTVI